MLSIRLYHCGVLKQLPLTEYVRGELSVYDFWGINDKTIYEINNRVDGIDYSGLKTLYFRISTLPIIVGFTLLPTEFDYNMLVGY